MGTTLAGDPSFIDALGTTGDQGFIPVLTEFLRYPWLLDDGIADALVAALVALAGDSGASYMDDRFSWDWWAEWVGRNTGVRATDGYFAFRRELFRRHVAPGVATFLSEGVKTDIRLEEVV